MTSRILPPAEWDRLAGTDADAVWATLDPTNATIVVIEERGQILAHHILIWVLHAEALWVHPDHRKTSVGGRLWQAVQEEVRTIGARAFMTASIDAEVDTLIAKVGGTPLPGTHFLVSVED